MNGQRFIVLAAIMMLGAPSALAGRLQIGTPVFEGDQVTVPVFLDGDVGVGVAALDFRLNYDPAVLQPVGALPGDAAFAANKQVAANMRIPGEYVVAVMGMNRTAIGSGEVVRIVLQKIAEPESGRSQLQITRTTLASTRDDAAAIPSQGSSREFRFYSDPTEDVEPEQADPDTRTTARSESDRPADDASAPSDDSATRQTVPSVPRLVPIAADEEPTKGSRTAASRPILGTALGQATGDSSQTQGAMSRRLMAAVREADRLRATIPGGTPDTSAPPRRQPVDETPLAIHLPVADNTGDLGVAPGVGKSVALQTSTVETRQEGLRPPSQPQTVAKLTTAEVARETAEQAPPARADAAEAQEATERVGGGFVVKSVAMALVIATLLGLFAIRKKLLS